MISNRPALAFLAASVVAICVTCTACSESGIAAPVLSDSQTSRSAALEVAIQISPASIEMDSVGTWVTVHADIPYSDVDGSTLTMNGVSPAAVKVDSRGDLVVKFDRPDVVAVVSPPEATLTLSGLTVTGEPFSGSSTVPVK